MLINKGDTMPQLSYCPADYCFSWNTYDRNYTWNSALAHETAKRNRDKDAKIYKSEGYSVKKWVNRNQYVRQSCGSIIRPGYRETDLLCDVYMLEVD